MSVDDDREHSASGPDQLCPVCNRQEGSLAAYPIRRVLVAVKPDDLHGLPLAATHARAVAQAAGAEVLLVTVVARPRRRVRESRDAAQARVMAEATAELEQIAQSMRDWGANVRTSAVCGAPAHEVVAAAAREWNADLLVVGVHEPRAFGTRFDDTDWQLLRHAPCPLLVVKDPTFDGYETILAAVDPLHDPSAASGLDAAVMAVARGVGAVLGSSLAIVSASPPSLELAPGIRPCAVHEVGGIEALHRAVIADFATRYGIAEEAVDVRPGAPAEVIAAVAEARGAELVVVGVQPRRNPLVAALGGTAERVAASLPCDVLLVPARVGRSSRAAATREPAPGGAAHGLTP